MKNRGALARVSLDEAPDHRGGWSLNELRHLAGVPRTKLRCWRGSVPTLAQRLHQIDDIGGPLYGLARGLSVHQLAQLEFKLILERGRVEMPGLVSRMCEASLSISFRNARIRHRTRELLFIAHFVIIAQDGPSRIGRRDRGSLTSSRSFSSLAVATVATGLGNRLCFPAGVLRKGPALVTFLITSDVSLVTAGCDELTLADLAFHIRSLSKRASQPAKHRGAHLASGLLLHRRRSMPPRSCNH